MAGKQAQLDRLAQLEYLETMKAALVAIPLLNRLSDGEAAAFIGIVFVQRFLVSSLSDVAVRLR